MQRFGIGIATLLVVQRTQIVERTCHIGMVGTERFLSNRQSSLVQRFGFVITTLVIVEQCQIIQRYCNFQMIRT